MRVIAPVPHGSAVTGRFSVCISDTPKTLFALEHFAFGKRISKDNTDWALDIICLSSQ